MFAAAEEALRNFGDYPWGNEVPKSSSSIISSSTISSSSSVSTVSASVSLSSSTTSSSASATPTLYLLTSKEGTDPGTFKNYVNGLDGGSGYLISYPNVPWQRYQTNLTSDQAKDAAGQSFMYFASPVTEATDAEGGAIPLKFGKPLQKRVADFRLGSASHLKLISENKNNFGQPNSAMNNYFFDDSLGEGQTIYVIDTGFRQAAEDFVNKGQNVLRDYVVPNQLTLALEPDPNNWQAQDATDYPPTYHGTHVASVAAGDVHGVASKANLVIVKFRNAARNSATGNVQMRGALDGALGDAWDWVLNDVATQRQGGNNNKFIVNFSYGFTQRESGASYAAKKAIMDQVVPRALAQDIVVVVSAGNNGISNNPLGLDQQSPQDQGTAGNALITVGGTDADGNLWKGTTPDLGRGGSITTYAQAFHVVMASGVQGAAANAEQTDDGTSFAAPAVAGLAAYFFSITSLASQWHAGTIAQDVKNYITSPTAHWQRQNDPIANAVPAGQPFTPPAAGSVKVAWNQALDGLCNNPSLISRLARRQSSGEDEPIVVGGTTVSEFATACSSTGTSLSSSPTSIPPTETSVPPIQTSVPPTQTSVPPTETSVPPTETSSSLPPLPTLTSVSESSVPPGSVPTQCVGNAGCSAVSVSPTSSSSSATASPSHTEKQLVNAGFYKACSTASCGPDDSGLVTLALWAHDTGTTYNGCVQGQNPTYEDTKDAIFDAKGPTYPATWGPAGSGGFSTATHTSCTLTMDEGEAGIISCGLGAITGTCTLSTAQFQDCDDGNGWQELQVCTI